ncbi:hypothetical protein NPIL_425591 [Nephila pilipes]|uniref:Uncharacterized protein n=1 Tax=Nephila pilipes TaxID=299642 RepID=A0A8X6Q5L3_NEPPI|nr:hypothetical protein NPIL_425591 [Nephila pilipes]
MVVLSWIKKKEPWNTFVGIRVKEIRDLTNIDDWRMYLERSTLQIWLSDAVIGWTSGKANGGRVQAACIKTKNLGPVLRYQRFQMKHFQSCVRQL